MIKSQYIPSRIIKILSISCFCLTTLGSKSACCSEGNDDHEDLRFSKAVTNNHKNITNIPNMNTDNPQYFNIELDSPDKILVVGDRVSNEGQRILFTRDRDFNLDADGNLKNPAGYFLMGWKLNDDGDIPAGTDTSAIDSLEVINATTICSTFRATSKMDVQVNLPANANAGDFHPVNTRAVDSLGRNHDVLMAYTKTANPLEWDITITSPDAAPSDVTQVSGVNNGATYNNVTIQFDNNGRLVSYNGVPTEVTPPQLNIDWASTDAENSLITVNFGTAGATDAIRIMGCDPITVQNNDNGRSLSPLKNIFVDAEGTVFSVFRNGYKQKIFKVAVDNVNTSKILR